MESGGAEPGGQGHQGRTDRPLLPHQPTSVHSPVPSLPTGGRWPPPGPALSCEFVTGHSGPGSEKLHLSNKQQAEKLI